MKSGLVNISPVHVLDKVILSHLWITKTYMSFATTLDKNELFLGKLPQARSMCLSK